MSKKKRDEFEGMGALEKCVADDSGGSADDAMKETESFDEAKAGNPEEGNAEEAAAKKKPKKHRTEDDTDSLKEELEHERDKTRSLAEIIEKVSNMPDEPVENENHNHNSVDVDSKMREVESKINGQVQSQMKDIRNTITAMGSKMEEMAKAEKPEKTGSRIKDMIDNVQAETSKKIADLQDEIRKMLDRMEQPKKEEEVSKGLAVFGGRVDIKNEMLDMRSSIKDVEKGLRELKDEMDTRITRIKEQMKILERFPTFEEKLEGLIERMSPANIEKLKKFIFSADEITGEIIPNEIEKKMGKELSPVFNDIKGVENDIEKANENIKTLFDEINFFKNEIKTLYKFGDYINDLQTNKEKLDDKIKEKEANLLSLVNKLEGILRKKAEVINDRIDKFDKSFTAKMEAKTKEYFDDLTEAKLLEIEDRTEKNLAVSRAKVNDMVSRFIQFQNVVNPTLSLIKEEIEKTDNRIEKIKTNQAEFQKEMEDGAKEMFSDIAGPQIKNISSDVAKFSKGINDRLEDFEAEFIQFQNVVNPTLTMFKNDISKADTKIEKLKTRHEDLKGNVSELADMRKSINSLTEWMKAMETRQKEADKRMLIVGSKLDETMAEFNTIVKQTFADRKKFEEENKRQREKINILLKELKSS
jgi:DNA repair exonuclease SbcCD ATPase subunit